MKKVLISLGVVVIFAGYAIYQHMHAAPALTPVSTPVSQTNTTPVTQNPPTSAATSTGSTQSASGSASASSGSNSAPASTATTSGQFKDGTYTGSVADAFYGKLQVVAIISGGKITDVQFPVFPNAPGHTTEVSNQALPQLKSEAIAAQSSKVQIISGATQDSQAFQQSLQSALAQAM